MHLRPYQRPSGLCLLGLGEQPAQLGTLDRIALQELVRIGQAGGKLIPLAAYLVEQLARVRKVRA